MKEPLVNTRKNVTIQAWPGIWPGVTPTELLKTKTLLLMQIPLSESGTDSIAGRLLGLAFEDLPLDEPMRAAKRYREITARDVK